MTSGGQSGLVPVQTSSKSQVGSTCGRQTVPALAVGWVQEFEVPSQTSRVHSLPSSGQAVFSGCLASGGQAALDPVQVSATSQTSAATRHTVPALPALWVQRPVALLHA